MQYPTLILYDGACGICRSEMERYKAKDKKARLKFVNVNRPDFKPENEGLDPKQIIDYIHAKDGDGKIVYGVDAFAMKPQGCSDDLAIIV